MWILLFSGCLFGRDHAPPRWNAFEFDAEIHDETGAWRLGSFAFEGYIASPSEAIRVQGEAHLQGPSTTIAVRAREATSGAEAPEIRVLTTNLTAYMLRHELRLLNEFREVLDSMTLDVYFPVDRVEPAVRPRLFFVKAEWNTTRGQDSYEFFADEEMRARLEADPTSYTAIFDIREPARMWGFNFLSLPYGLGELSPLALGKVSLDPGEYEVAGTDFAIGDASFEIGDRRFSGRSVSARTIGAESADQETATAWVHETLPLPARFDLTLVSGNRTALDGHFELTSVGPR